MNWLTNFVRPKIKAIFNRKDVPENLWKACPTCKKLNHHKELTENLFVCNNCNYHFNISPDERLKMIFDKYQIIEVPSPPEDPLEFTDIKRYKQRIKENRNKTNFNDAFVLSSGKIDNKEILVGILNFDFMGGSMGRAVGESFVYSAKMALEKKFPLVVFTASGGARMQEGIISLMQMPRTVAATEMLKKHNIPFLIVLTNPTTGGVTASFAMLGDITIAETGATIGFAGKRVIQDTINESLPTDFQKSEYLKSHGMIDVVVDRKELVTVLESVIDYLDN